LKPPFLALVRGVLMASVMTTSSGFWEVLLGEMLLVKMYFYHGGDGADLGKVVERGFGDAMRTFARAGTCPE